MTFYTVRYDLDWFDLDAGETIAPRAVIEAATAQQALDRGSEALDCPIDDISVRRLKHGEISLEERRRFYRPYTFPVFYDEAFNRKQTRPG